MDLSSLAKRVPLIMVVYVGTSTSSRIGASRHRPSEHGDHIISVHELGLHQNDSPLRAAFLPREAWPCQLICKVRLAPRIRRFNNVKQIQGLDDGALRLAA
jgi:hypothetical protein